MRYCQLFVYSVVVISVSSPISLGWLSTSSQAQVADQIIPTPTPENPFPPPPPGSGSPRGRRQGGASRGSCHDDLTALVPQVEGYVWGLTAAQHPTLWFYLSSIPEADQRVEFVLQDSDNSYIHRTEFPLTDLEVGIIGIEIPESSPGLEVDQTYLWTVTLNCDSSAWVYVQGSLHRVEIETSLQDQVAQGTPIQQSLLYQSQGIWHEALTVLAKTRLDNPDSQVALQRWTELLQLANLDVRAADPLLPCCPGE